MKSKDKDSFENYLKDENIRQAIAHERVRFRNLSTPLKWAIVGGWIALILDTFSFLLGFIEGVMGI